MQTYRAKLAPFRMRPLHPEYRQRALDCARRMVAPGGARIRMNETTCPYCGVEDRLVGTLRVGAKKQVTDIPMTREGYVVPNAKGKETEILCIDCLACGAAIEPLSYTAPAVFLRQKEDIPELERLLSTR